MYTINKAPGSSLNLL